jgi:hypothetical protein
VLVEQQSLHPCAPAGQPRTELGFAELKGISTQPSKSCMQIFWRDQDEAAESPDVGVAQPVAVVEREDYMRMGWQWCFGWLYDKLARHSQMHQQAAREAKSICGGQMQHKVLSVAPDTLNLATGQIPTECFRILHKICHAQGHMGDASPR